MGWPANVVSVPMFLSTQSVSIATASATASSALPAATVKVRLSANTGVFYNFVASASAQAGAFLPANTVEYVACQGALAISFLADTTSGRVNVVPCSA